MSRNKPKAKADKNSGKYLSSSVSKGRGKSIMDFMENFDAKPVTYKQGKRGKFRKLK